MIANGNNDADNAAASDADAAAMAAMDPPSEAQEEVKQAIAELASAIDAMDAELDTNENNAVNDNTQGGDDDVTTINHNHLNSPNKEED